MESTLQGPAVVAAKANPRAGTVYWIFTALFCLQMSFTAYAQLRLPQMAEMFTHLGFSAYFRVVAALGVGTMLLFPLFGRAPVANGSSAAVRSVCVRVQYFAFAFQLAGVMLWFTRNTLAGSYAFLTAARRA